MFFTHNFWIRQLLAFAMQASGVEVVPDQAMGWPDYFDNTDGIGEVKRTLFYKDRRSGIMLPYKGRAKPVEVESKIGIEAHITAVSFGTTKRARAFWRKQIEQGLIPDEVVQKYAFGFDPAMPDWTERVAERMALHQRFWKVPYHYVGLLNGDVLFNNPITRYTHHGNGGNGPLVGVSAEANLPGLEKWKENPEKRPKKFHDLDEHFIETNRATIRLATVQSREAGAEIQTLYAHRQYSDGRLGDPGEGWWKEVGIPMAAELDLERRVTFKHGSGNEICREWDPDGRVNYRGHRLAA